MWMKMGKTLATTICAFAPYLGLAAKLAVDASIVDWQADILHLNDWQTGFAAAYLASWKLPHPPVVTTVHNLRYNGSFDMYKFADTQISYDLLTMHGMEFYGRFSGLKAGLVYADAITTVSPTYASEILTAEYGDGLDGVLNAMSDKLVGILNGVDYQQWNPAIDKLIAQTYDADTLDDKNINKQALLKENQLNEETSQPVFGVVSRLTEQKGLDLILQAMPSLLEAGAKFVLLGSGDKSLEQGFLALEKRYPQQVAIRLGYDEAYSHRLQAGVDVLLIPSRFEPCGLTQLYALKYGTLPLVRQTGGLADTVFETGERPNGFHFKEASVEALSACLWRAMDAYQQPDLWRQWQLNAMQYDHSWESVTDQWLDLYQSLINKD